MQNLAPPGQTRKQKKSPSPKQILSLGSIKFVHQQQPSNFQSHQTLQESSTQGAHRHNKENLTPPPYRDSQVPQSLQIMNAVVSVTQKQVNLSTQLETSISNSVVHFQKSDSQNVNLLENERYATPNQLSINPSATSVDEYSSEKKQEVDIHLSKKSEGILGHRNSNASAVASSSHHLRPSPVDLSSAQTSNANNSQLNLSSLQKKLKQSPSIKKVTKQFPTDFFGAGGVEKTGSNFQMQPSHGSPLSNYQLQLSNRNGFGEFDSSPIEQRGLDLSRIRRFKFPVVSNLDDQAQQIKEREPSHLYSSKINKADTVQEERRLKSPSSNERLKKLLQSERMISDRETLKQPFSTNEHQPLRSQPFDGLKTQMLNLSIDSDKIKKYGLQIAVKNAVSNSNLSEKRSRKLKLREQGSTIKRHEEGGQANSIQFQDPQTEESRNQSAISGESYQIQSRAKTLKHIRDDQSRNKQARAYPSMKFQTSNGKKVAIQNQQLSNNGQQNQVLVLPELMSSQIRLNDYQDASPYQNLNELQIGLIPNLTDSLNLQESLGKPSRFESKRVPVHLRRLKHHEDSTQNDYYQNQFSSIQAADKNEKNEVSLPQSLQRDRTNITEISQMIGSSPQSSQHTQNDISISQAQSNQRLSLNSSNLVQQNHNHHNHHYWSRSPPNQRDLKESDPNVSSFINQTANLQLPLSTRNLNSQRTQGQNQVVKFPNIFNHGGIQLNSSSLGVSQLSASHLNLSQAQENFALIKKKGKVVVNHPISTNQDNYTAFEGSASPLNPKTISYTAHRHIRDQLNMESSSRSNRGFVIQERRETSESENSFQQNTDPYHPRFSRRNYNLQREFELKCDNMDLGDEDEYHSVGNQSEDQYMGLDRQLEPLDYQNLKKNFPQKVDRKMLTSRDQEERWVRNLEFKSHNPTLDRNQSRSNLERNKHIEQPQRYPRKLKLKGEEQRRDQDKMGLSDKLSRSGICFYNSHRMAQDSKSNGQFNQESMQRAIDASSISISPESAIQNQPKKMHMKGQEQNQDLSEPEWQVQKQFRSEEFKRSSNVQRQSRLKNQGQPRYSLPENDSNMAEYQDIADQVRQRIQTRDQTQRAKSIQPRESQRESKLIRQSIINSESQELLTVKQQNRKIFNDQSDTPCFKQFEKSFKSSVPQTGRSSSLGQKLTRRDLDGQVESKGEDSEDDEVQKQKQLPKKSIKQSYLNFKTQLALNDPKIMEIQSQEVMPFDFNPNHQSIFEQEQTSKQSREKTGVYDGSTVKFQAKDMRDSGSKAQSLHLEQRLPANYDNPSIEVSREHNQRVERVSLQGNVEAIHKVPRSLETSRNRLQEGEVKKLKVISKSKFKLKNSQNPLHQNPADMSQSPSRQPFTHIDEINKARSKNDEMTDDQCSAEQQEQTQTAQSKVSREGPLQPLPPNSLQIKESNSSNGPSAHLVSSQSQPQIAKKIPLIKKSQIQSIQTANSSDMQAEKVSIVKTNSNKLLINSNSQKAQNFIKNSSDPQITVNKVSNQGSGNKIQNQGNDFNNDDNQQSHNQNLDNEHDLKRQSYVRVQQPSNQVYSKNYMQTSHFAQESQAKQMAQYTQQNYQSGHFNTQKSSTLNLGTQNQDQSQNSYPQKQGYFTAKSSQEFDQQSTVTPCFNTKHPSITQQINQIYMAAQIPKEFNGMITFMNIQQHPQNNPSNSNESNSASISADQDAFHNTGGSLMRATILSLTTTSLNDGAGVNGNIVNHTTTVQSFQNSLGGSHGNTAFNQNFVDISSSGCGGNFNQHSNLGGHVNQNANNLQNQGQILGGTTNSNIVVVQTQGNYQVGAPGMQNAPSNSQQLVILQQQINQQVNQTHQVDVQQEQRKPRGQPKKIKLKVVDERDQNKENISRQPKNNSSKQQKQNQDIDSKNKGDSQKRAMHQIDMRNMQATLQ